MTWACSEEERREGCGKDESGSANWKTIFSAVEVTVMGRTVTKVEIYHMQSRLLEDSVV